MDDYSSDQSTPWAAYKSSITSVLVEDGITSVGNCAFGNINTLTKATLSDSVTRIGTEAFAICRNLTDFTISSSLTLLGVNAFAYCGFTSIELPNTLTEIPASAFQRSSLQSITIPSTITQIGEAAFKGTSLTTVNYDGTHADWNRISIGLENEKLTSANIDYLAEAHYVVVYDDGTMVFQASNEAISGKTISNTYEVDAKIGDEPAWRDESYNVTTVVFESPVAPMSTAHWFQNFNKLTEIKRLDQLDTSNVTSMRWMFMSCSKLAALDVSKFDTRNVTDMYGMWCASFAELLSHRRREG